jgi:hypothetical protein
MAVAGMPRRGDPAWVLPVVAPSARGRGAVGDAAPAPWVSPGPRSAPGGGRDGRAPRGRGGVPRVIGSMDPAAR